MTGPAVRDYQLLLPAGWVRVPLDDKVQARLVTLSTLQVRTVPVAQRETARQALVRLLGDAVREAEEVGATDLLLSLAEVRGFPISASCLVTHLPAPGAGLDVVHQELLDLDGDVSLLEVAGGKAVRRVVRRELPLDRDRLRALAAAAGRDLDEHQARDVPTPVVEELSYFVPVPGSTDLLVFSFSSTQPELAAALGRLFDAIMGTMRWIP